MAKKIVNKTPKCISIVGNKIEPYGAITISNNSITETLLSQIDVFKKLNYISIFEVAEEVKRVEHPKAEKKQSDEQSSDNVEGSSAVFKRETETNVDTDNEEIKKEQPKKRSKSTKKQTETEKEEE